MAHIFTVPASRIFAHPNTSLSAFEYDNDAKRDRLQREANKARARAEILLAKAAELEAKRDAIPPGHPVGSQG